MYNGSIGGINPSFTFKEIEVFKKADLTSNTWIKSKDLDDIDIWQQFCKLQVLKEDVFEKQSNEIIENESDDPKILNKIKEA